MANLVFLAGFATSALCDHSMYPTTTVYDWGEVHHWGTYDCQHSMATNWFELAPGDSVEFPLDLSGCEDAYLGGAFFFGNYAKKNSGPQLNSTSKVLLECSDAKGTESATDGSIYMALDGAGVLTLRAVNMNRNKTLTTRLRFESGM
jgi:hypothetical protein